MKIITSITTQPRQNFIIKLDNGESVNFNLYFYRSQYAWYYDFEYNDYISQGNKVVCTMNSIRHLKNILPFGIGFLSLVNADPFQLESFYNQDCVIAIWNEEEVQMLEDTVYAPQ